MTNFPTSSSESDGRSQAFARLHPKFQRWVHTQGWTTLHDAQERAIGPILDGVDDVIISAATAAGKTEAAFLPICSALAATRDEKGEVPADPWVAHDPWAPVTAAEPTGIEVLYVSPLKALINDQYDRLDLLCHEGDISVHRWHGDVSGHSKQKILRSPSGVLLITPESLEAIFVNRGHETPTLFAGVRYVVVDELHSFLSTPRGAQLQSLLGRVELAIRRQPPRIGLSATLGDMAAAASFLRPTDSARVVVIESASDQQELRLQVRGYRRVDPQISARQATAAESEGREIDIEDTVDGDRIAVADHLFRMLRGTDNLVFANARRDVELYADLLARRCERERVPNEFWPHHGSLAKDVRELVEAQLKDRARPVTAVCTSTLEMGIDIGTVASIAQVGPPPSVSALRQRLGRSGRRGEPAVMRIYITEDDVTVRTAPSDELRCGLVQSIAMVKLLLERWIEPPDDAGLNLSTLIQQVLSMIAQHGGAVAVELHRALCGPGPFVQVDAARFARLLRTMASADLVSQAGDGTLLHGLVGERIVNHYSFYTAFQTPQEWRLVADGRPLGTLPITQPLVEGGLLIFAGRRWKIVAIESTAHVVELTRAAGGVPPNFGGTSARVGDRVRAEMANAYRSDDVPGWLDREASALFAEGRAAWRRFGLDDSILVAAGKDTVALPWVGDRSLITTMLALASAGLEASVEGPTLTVTDCVPEQLIAAARQLIAGPVPDPVVIARQLKNVELDKWDWVLDEDLAAEAAAARLLDADGAWRVLHMIAGRPLASNIAAATQDAPMPSTPASSAKDPDGSPGGRRNRRGGGLGAQEFCVIDVETTGFSPRLQDRVIEIAAVRMRGDGRVLAEWSTLVNPSRDIGATHVHGITAGDVLDAPHFDEIAGDVLAQMDGAVIVAHNLRFDWEFVASEFQRSGHELPRIPGLCTLALGSRIHPESASRRLAACCERIGYSIPRAHAALEDARAAGVLLAAYVADAWSIGLGDLETIGCEPLVWPDAFPVLPVSGKRCERGQQQAAIADQGSYLARLVAKLDDAEVAEGIDADAYFDVLDRALEDRRLSGEEADALHATARAWGLDAQDVAAAHVAYFDSLVATALADGVVTDNERADLDLVATLLGLPLGGIDNALGAGVDLAVSASTPSQASLSGLSVCFTGTLAGRIEGEPITRTVARQLANDAGLDVRDNVTKGLDLLVVADPDSQSGKAKRARELGTRVMAEAVFWRSIGVATE